jgi:predicted nucleic acid-binding protein
VTKYVIDASVAVKWVVTETGTQEAVKLLRGAPFAAPDLLVAECANILWKKVQRKQLTAAEALLAARLLQRADIEYHPTRHLLDSATQLAIGLNHPACDCIYLTLAILNGWRFVTADDRLVGKVRSANAPAAGLAILSIAEAVQELQGSP